MKLAKLKVRGRSKHLRDVFENNSSSFHRQNPTSFPLPHLTRSTGSSSLFTSTVHLPSSSSSPPRHCCTLEHPHSLPLSGKMKLIRGLLRSVNLGSPYQFQLPQIVRAFSMNPNSGSDDTRGTNSFESHDDFERRIFGDDGFGSSSKSNAFYQKLERAEKAHDRSGFSSKFNLGNRSEFLDGLDDSFSSLSDGMDAKLRKEATYFEFDQNEIEKDGYGFRPDVPFRKWQTYETKELDLTKPGVPKPMVRDEFEVTTEEVLRKADFRNVRFLANFLTEAGIIIKRSKTKISAKAQRKVAREIKTARAFGLMPFTTMGTKRFAFGQTMENLDQDYEYDTYDTRSFVDEDQNPLRG